MNTEMSVKVIPEGVIYRNEEESRLTILLLVPFYSFFEKYETRRAGWSGFDSSVRRDAA